MALGSRRAETLPMPPGEALSGSQPVWFSKLLLFCSLHEVETRSSQCGLKGQFAVCKPIGRDKRVLGTPQAGSLTPPHPRIQRKASYPVEAGRGLARQLAVHVFRLFPVTSLLSPLSCADQLRCHSDSVSPAAPLHFVILSLAQFLFCPCSLHFPWPCD